MDLPDPVPAYILQYLDDASLCACRLVCSTWRDYIDSSFELWSLKCDYMGISPQPEAGLQSVGVMRENYQSLVKGWRFTLPSTDNNSYTQAGLTVDYSPYIICKGSVWVSRDFMVFKYKHDQSRMLFTNVINFKSGTCKSILEEDKIHYIQYDFNPKDDVLVMLMKWYKAPSQICIYKASSSTYQLIKKIQINRKVQRSYLLKVIPEKNRIIFNSFGCNKDVITDASVFLYSYPAGEKINQIKLPEIERPVVYQRHVPNIGKDCSAVVSLDGGIVRVVFLSRWQLYVYDLRDDRMNFGFATDSINGTCIVTNFSVYKGDLFYIREVLVPAAGVEGHIDMVELMKMSFESEEISHREKIELMKMSLQNGEISHVTTIIEAGKWTVITNYPNITGNFEIQVKGVGSRFAFLFLHNETGPFTFRSINALFLLDLKQDRFNILQHECEHYFNGPISTCHLIKPDFLDGINRESVSGILWCFFSESSITYGYWPSLEPPQVPKKLHDYAG